MKYAAGYNPPASWMTVGDPFDPASLGPAAEGSPWRLPPMKLLSVSGKRTVAAGTCDGTLFGGDLVLDLRLPFAGDGPPQVDRGHARSTRDAFDRFLGGSGVAYVENNPLFAEQVIPLVRAAGGLCALFPGQGAQYPGMLREVAAAYPRAAAVVDACDRILAGLGFDRTIVALEADGDDVFARDPVGAAARHLRQRRAACRTSSRAPGR